MQRPWSVCSDLPAKPATLRFLSFGKAKEAAKLANGAAAALSPKIFKPPSRVVPVEYFWFRVCHPEILNPKCQPQIQNPKPETPNLKP